MKRYVELVRNHDGDILYAVEVFHIQDATDKSTNKPMYVQVINGQIENVFWPGEDMVEVNPTDLPWPNTCKYESAPKTPA